MTMPACPRCHSEVQDGWDWCHVCGFDPDGLKPPDPDWRDLPSPRFGETPNWAAPIGQPTGFAPGVGAPQWGPPPTGPGLPTTGHAHPKPRRSGTTVVLVIVAGLVIAFVVLLVVTVAAVTLLGRSADVVGKQTGSTVPPGSARWVAQDGSVSADFPVTPTQGLGPPAGRSTAAGTSWQASSAGISYFVTVAPLVPGARVDATASLNSGIDGFNSKFPGTFHERTPTTVNGFKAEQFAVTGANGTMVRGTVVVSPHGLYIIAAAGSPTQQAALDAFRDSLHVPA
jgi:hypothetical protein